MKYRLLYSIILLLLLTSTVFGSTISYVYDELDRLHEVTLDNGQKITYEYDEIGNMTSRTGPAGVSGTTGTSDGFINGTSLSSPWVFYGGGNGLGSITTLAVASAAGHSNNAAIDIHTSSSNIMYSSSFYYFHSTKNRNSCSFWYKMPNIFSNGISLYWGDGTGSWVDDGDGGQYWQDSYYSGNLIADGTWRQFIIPTFSTYVQISRGTSSTISFDDYFDSFIEN